MAMAPKMVGTATYSHEIVRKRMINSDKPSIVIFMMFAVTIIFHVCCTLAAANSFLPKISGLYSNLNPSNQITERRIMSSLRNQLSSECTHRTTP